MTALGDPRPWVERGVGLLHQLGLRAGDRVVTLLPNSLSTFGLGVAATLQGVVQVPLLRDLGPAEIERIISDAAPSCVLAGPDTPALSGTSSTSAVPVHLVDEDTVRDTAARTPGSDHPRTRPMSYTSGTTGQRKGVAVGVHDPTWGQQVMADEHAAFERRHGQRHLVVSPLSHSGPFRFAQVAAAHGGQVAVMPGFDAVEWLHALRALRPTSMFCVPTHLHRLLALPDLQADDLASLSLLAHAGAPCPTPLKERLLALAPEGSVWEFYGATEGQFTVCPPGDWRRDPGTVGHSRPGRRLEIRDDDGKALPSGVTGTVWVHAPTHARWQYWGAPERTAQAWDGDAFTVGDLGHLDAATGLLHLDGRPGDLIISGGVNVYPAEVERHLLADPAVAEAVVFAVPDPEWGERVVAAVVPWPDRPVDPTALRGSLREQLPAAQVPKRIAVVAELPRTATGKIRRAGLTALLPDETSAPHIDAGA